MDADHLAVDVVIQTATGVLTGRFGPREAVTILASQVPHARSSAAVLCERDPAWSAAHAELLGAWPSCRRALPSRGTCTPWSRSCTGSPRR